MNYQTECEDCKLKVNASTESALDKAMERHYKTEKHKVNSEPYVDDSPGPRPMKPFLQG